MWAQRARSREAIRARISARASSGSQSHFSDMAASSPTWVNITLTKTWATTGTDGRRQCGKSIVALRREPPYEHEKGSRCGGHQPVNRVPNIEDAHKFH